MVYFDTIVFLSVISVFCFFIEHEEWWKYSSRISCIIVIIWLFFTVHSFHESIDKIQISQAVIEKRLGR